MFYILLVDKASPANYKLFHPYNARFFEEFLREFSGLRECLADVDAQVGVQREYRNFFKMITSSWRGCIVKR